MARPVKTGLEYFPFDVDFFSDEKLYAISGEFGLKGEITTVKLLCAVYRNGYFVEWSEMLKYKLLKELPGVSADLLEQIIRRLVKWDFFDEGLFNSASILTSRGIQRRYQTISTKMHRKNIITAYSLINAPTQKDTPTRKVQATHATAPRTKQVEVDKSKPTLDEAIAALLSDTIWIEPVCMRYGLTDKQFKMEIKDFHQNCLCMAKQPDTVADAKRYFCSWLSKKKSRVGKTKTETTAQSISTDYSYTGGFGSKDK